MNYIHCYVDEISIPFRISVFGRQELRPSLVDESPMVDESSIPLYDSNGGGKEMK